ncbi:MAG: hypothetical protein ACE5J9_06100 [Methanosarcinales archaeon]
MEVIKVNTRKIIYASIGLLILVGSINIAYADPPWKQWNKMPHQYDESGPHSGGMDMDMDMDMGGMNQMHTPSHMPPIAPILRGHGFALNETNMSNFHVLSVNMMSAGRMPAPNMFGLVMRMLDQGNTCQEIQTTLNEIENNTPVYRGFMKFADTQYLLNITELNNVSGSAEILEMSGLNVVGTISVTREYFEGEWIGTGNMTLDGQDYNVLLYMAHRGPHHHYNVPSQSSPQGPQGSPRGPRGMMH